MSTDPAAGGGRLAEFEAEVAELRIKGGSAERERQYTVGGLALMVAGAAVALIMGFLSQGASDSRDELTYLIFAVFGLSLAVAGGVLWLRYSMSRYLRYWLLRLIYEQRQSSGS